MNGRDDKLAQLAYIERELKLGKHDQPSRKGMLEDRRKDLLRDLKGRTT